jgi:hypothetical protein
MLAKKVFAHTAAYDGMITNYLSALEAGSELETEAVPAKRSLPAVFNLQLVKTQDMRYGENPHQSAAFYREAAPAAGTLAQLDAAAGQGAVLQQHRRRRRGLGMRQDLRRAGLRDRQARQPLRRGGGRQPAGGLRQGLETDPTSAFGGIMAFNRPLDADVVAPSTPTSSSSKWLIAPAVTPEARAAVRRQAERAPAGGAAGRRRPTRWTSSAWAAACCCSRPTKNVGAQPNCAWSPSCNPPSSRWRPAVRLEGGQVRQEQRHRVLRRRHDAGRGRRPDEPHRQRPHRPHQGRQRRAEPGRLGGGQSTPSSPSATGWTW